LAWLRNILDAYVFWKRLERPKHKNIGTYFNLRTEGFLLLPNAIDTLSNKKLLKKIESARQQKQPYSKYTKMLDALSKKVYGEHVCRLPTLHLASRRELLKNLSAFTSDTAANYQRGNGGNGRIILGPKGIGKSTFLQSFAIATSLLFHNVVVIYIDYGRHKPENPILPSEMLWNAYKCWKNEEILDKSINQNRLTEVADEIKISNLSFIIIVDEFDKVYKFPNRVRGMEIIQQFQAIGGGTDGLITAIISGSSAALYDLCFGLHDVLDNQFPSYTGISLNNGRYTVLRSHPLRRKEQFLEILTHIVENDETDHEDMKFFDSNLVRKIKKIIERSDDEQLEQLYMMSGGKFRNLQQSLKSTTEYLLDSMRKFIENYNGTFAEIIKRLVAKREKYQSKASIWEDTWLELDDMNDLDISKIYQLGDTNKLFVVQENCKIKVTFETMLQLQFWKVRILSYNYTECINGLVLEHAF
jgi:hypothetical protein